MLIASIIGSESTTHIAGLINRLLSSNGKKVSVIDSSSLAGLDLKRIKAYTGELEKNNVDILLLKTRIYDAEKLFSGELKPDVVIYTEKEDKDCLSGKKEGSEKLKNIISLMGEKGIAIVNIDESGIDEALQGPGNNFVTYGFNARASVTTSSIGDTLFKDSFICCLQRPIPTHNGDIIEPQEYKLKLESGEIDSHDVLAAASFAIINGVDINNYGNNRMNMPS